MLDVDVDMLEAYWPYLGPTFMHTSQWTCIRPIFIANIDNNWRGLVFCEQKTGDVFPPPPAA